MNNVYFIVFYYDKNIIVNTVTASSIISILKLKKCGLKHSKYSSDTEMNDKLKQNTKQAVDEQTYFLQT